MPPLIDITRHAAYFRFTILIADFRCRFRRF